VTTKEMGPAVADSPVKTPVVLRENSCGRPDALQLYSEKSPLPPAARNLKLYGAPAVAAGIAGGVTMVSADSTTNVKSLLLVLLELSATVSAKVYVPPLGGVELVLRVPLGSSESQAGRHVEDQMYPPVPPVAIKVYEAAKPKVAGWRGDEVAIANMLFTGRVNAWLAEFDDVSVTVTLKVTGPDVGGTPLRMPFGPSVSQDGSPVAVKVYVPEPPVAVIVVV
jgi:hypothetical protein